MLTHLELFQSIMLGIAQAKRVDALLPMIVSGLVERADFALPGFGWSRRGIQTPKTRNDFCDCQLVRAVHRWTAASGTE